MFYRNYSNNIKSISNLSIKSKILRTVLLIKVKQFINENIKS